MGDTSTGAINIKTAPAGRGVDWLLDGFGIFQKNWLAWIGIQIFLIFLMLFLSVIPLIGSVLQIILPVFMGGLMLGCQAADRDDNFSFGHLFAGFSNHFWQLLIIGIIHLLGVLLILVLCFFVLISLLGGLDALMDIFQSLLNATMENDINRLIEIASEFSLIILLVELIGLALYVPLLVLLWFAPALVMLENMSAITAMKYSFIGCMKNLIPYLVYGVIGLILSIIATIPLGLGWFILTPMIIASIYLSYKDIYIKNED